MKRRRLSKSDRELVYRKTNGKCAYCGCELDINAMQVDHIKSLRTGGDDALDNMLPACRECNYYKSTFNIDKFRSELSKIVDRLQKVFIFRLALKYQLIEIKNKEIVFKFEVEEEHE